MAILVNMNCFTRQIILFYHDLNMIKLDVYLIDYQ